MSTATELPPGPPVSAGIQGLLASAVLGASSLGLPGAPRLRSPTPGVHALRRRYGPLFTVNLPGFGRAVVVSDPELIKQVFAAPADTLHFGEDSPLGAVLGPHSLFSLDGRPHAEQRKLVMPPFHGERMHAYEAIVEQETLAEIAQWPRRAPFRTLEPMMRVTLNIIIRAVFGADGARYKKLAAELRAVMPEMIALGSRLAGFPFLQRDLGPWSPWGRMQHHRRRFDWGVNTLVDDARRDPDLERRTDVLAMFAQATHEGDGSPMTDGEIADELITLLAAGHETTATTMAWMFERLTRHPEILDRLSAEADGDGRALREATIYEVQRTRPVIPGTGRLVVKPFALGDYVLPAGTMIMISATLTHEDPRLFPHPEAFDPDRFLGRRPDPFAWVPFGGGRRRCPGAAFAHMEMDIALRTVLREFALVPSAKPDEAWHFRGIAFAPADGGRLSVSGRRRTSAASSAPPARSAA